MHLINHGFVRARFINKAHDLPKGGIFVRLPRATRFINKSHDSPKGKKIVRLTLNNLIFTKFIILDILTFLAKTKLKSSYKL